MNQKFSYNKNSDKVIWIDLDNSPHVPFFDPIINALCGLGYNVQISTRNYSQTVQLADQFQLDYYPVGKHYGKNKFVKIVGLFYRAFQLLPFAIKNKPTVAISHGSRSQMIAAHFLKIPIIMFLDYEYIQTIPFVTPNLIFLPSIISTEKFNTISSKIVPYPGIKEDVYVPSFDPSILDYLGLSKDRINVVLRPPAHEAHYHNPESEVLFHNIIKFLINNSNVTTIIIPRDNKQKFQIKSRYKKYLISKRLVVPDEVINGLNIIWNCDLVISGGGTMNREAAALGVPVYSIFKGKIGDVDKYLSENGKLHLIEDEKDLLRKLKLIKRKRPVFSNKLNSLALQTIINEIENYLHPPKLFNSSKNRIPYEYDKQLSKELHKE